MKESDDGFLTAVELSGTDAAKQKAKKLLEAFVSPDNAVDMYESKFLLPLLPTSQNINV